jgi:aspartyl-tRNA synthetase
MVKKRPEEQKIKIYNWGDRNEIKDVDILNIVSLFLIISEDENYCSPIKLKYRLYDLRIQTQKNLIMRSKILQKLGIF